MEIVPTILTASRKELEKKVEFLFHKTSWAQIDVVDGKFAPHKTFPLDWLQQYEREGLFWEIHLMVKNPFSWVERCDRVFSQRVVGQVEFMRDENDFIDRVENEGMEAGLALDLATPLVRLNQEAVFRARLILLLGVKAGFSGQKFNPNLWQKLDELVRLRDDLGANFAIGVDGGITLSLIPLLNARGVDIAYVGSSLWQKPNWEEALIQLKKAAQKKKD